MQKRNFGFTLAEVLIVVGIIGVVAAITIPFMMSKYQKIVYENQLKKTVAVFQNGMKRIVADGGGDSILDGDVFKPCEWFEYYFCTDKRLLTVFSAATVNDYDDTYMVMQDFTFVEKMILPDGSFVFFRFENYDTSNKYIGLVLFDINGDKKPNVAGRDIFIYSVDKTGHIYPITKYYTDLNDLPECKNPEKNNTTNMLYSCSNHILENNWKMDY